MLVSSHPAHAGLPRRGENIPEDLEYSSPPPDDPLASQKMSEENSTDTPAFFLY